MLEKKLPKKTLFYFDPPYYVNGKDLYLNHYADDDHQNLSTVIKSVEAQRWILTYDNVLPIKNLYAGYRQKKYSLNYSANKAVIGQELMIFSNNTYIPRHSGLG
jgi:DNA adenine methylase